LDSSSVHCDQQLVEWCRARKLFLRFLPKYSTNVLQPAGETFKESDFIKLIKEVIDNVPVEIIKKSFETTGIFPFDSNKNLHKFINEGE
jgi:hypothetical protein